MISAGFEIRHPASYNKAGSLSRDRGRLSNSTDMSGNEEWLFSKIIPEDVRLPPILLFACTAGRLGVLFRNLFIALIFHNLSMFLIAVGENKGFSYKFPAGKFILGGG